MGEVFLLMLLVVWTLLAVLFVFMMSKWRGDMKNLDSFSDLFRFTGSVEGRDKQEYYASKQWKQLKQIKLGKAKKIHNGLYVAKSNIYAMREDTDHPFGEVACIKTGKRLDHLCLVNKNGLKKD